MISLVCILYASNLVSHILNILIFISEKPVINPFGFPQSLAEGMHVIVTCSVLTGDPPITIRWLKDGMTLNKKMLNIEESSMGHLGSALVFNSVGRSHNGNYTCLAENLAGESNFTATMLVNGKYLILKFCLKTF